MNSNNIKTKKRNVLLENEDVYAGAEDLVIKQDTLDDVKNIGSVTSYLGDLTKEERDRLRKAEEDKRYFTKVNAATIKYIKLADGRVIDMETVRKRFDYIRNLIIYNLPGVGRVLAHLQIEYTFLIKRAATDGFRIFFNPIFAYNLEKEYPVVGLFVIIVHEALHCFHQHHKRREANKSKFPNHTQANIAMDYEINALIECMLPQYAGIFGKDALNGYCERSLAGQIWEDIYFSDLVQSDMMKRQNPNAPKRAKIARGNTGTSDTEAEKMTPKQIEMYKNAKKDAHSDLSMAKLLDIPPKSEYDNIMDGIASVAPDFNKAAGELIGDVGSIMDMNENAVFGFCSKENTFDPIFEFDDPNQTNPVDTTNQSVDYYGIGQMIGEMYKKRLDAINKLRTSGVIDLQDQDVYLDEYIHTILMRIDPTKFDNKENDTDSKSKNGEKQNTGRNDQSQQKNQKEDQREEKQKEQTDTDELEDDEDAYTEQNDTTADGAFKDDDDIITPEQGNAISRKSGYDSSDEVENLYGNSAEKKWDNIINKREAYTISDAIMDDIRNGIGNQEKLDRFAEKNPEVSKLSSAQKTFSPNSMRAMVEKMKSYLVPTVNWKAVLKRFLISGNSNPEISYFKKSVIHKDLYFPKHKDTGGVSGATVLCLIDTSGSISDFELNSFLSEVISIAETKMIWVEHIAVMCFDTEVRSVDLIRRKDFKKFKKRVDTSGYNFAGRGGTDFIQAIADATNWLSVRGVNGGKGQIIDTIIMFTDGLAQIPPVESVRNLFKKSGTKNVSNTMMTRFMWFMITNKTNDTAKGHIGKDGGQSGTGINFPYGTVLTISKDDLLKK